MTDPVSVHHEQALPTQQLANPANSWHFGFRRRCVSKQHIKGDRETALACQKVVLKCCGNELIERLVAQSLSLSAQGSVWVESIESL